MEPSWGSWLLLALLGFAASVYGSLIGAGGGFILVPALLLLFPEESASLITAIALTVATINAISGSIAYARQRRIDYYSLLILGLPTIPGAILAAYLTRFIERGPFDALLGLILFALAMFLILRPQPRFVAPQSYQGRTLRFITDASGISYMYSYNRLLAIAIGATTGFIATFFGIGGATLQVPLMIQFLHFPAHIATATGLGVILIKNPFAVVTHILAGTFNEGIRRTVALAIGASIGGQLGAWLSTRIRAVWLVRALALGLALAGLRLMANGWDMVVAAGKSLLGML
jgi:uncharacterized membrane protein YfcA